MAATGNTISLVLPNMGQGGAERVNLNLANAFVARGFQVDAVLMRATGDFLPLLDPRVRVVDLHVDRVRGALLPLMRYLKERRPNVMLANMWPLTGVAVVARSLARSRTRLVTVEHTSWFEETLVGRNPLTSFAMHVLLPRGDAVLAVSEGAAEDLRHFSRLPTGSVDYIYNPIVCSRSDGARTPVPDNRWGEGSHKRILAVGELKAAKDFHNLLHAFALLRQTVDARLVVLGEGTMRPELEALIASLGLAGSVRMPGFDPVPGPYYAGADLFVLSSDHEGFGNVIVEALEQGTPVVSTDCRSGPREILCDGRFGRLVPIHDAQALAAGMAASLAEEHDSSALMERALDFSVDTIAERYLDVLLPGWRDTREHGCADSVGQISEQHAPHEKEIG